MYTRAVINASPHIVPRRGTLELHEVPQAAVETSRQCRDMSTPPSRTPNRGGVPARQCLRAVATACTARDLCGLVVRKQIAELTSTTTSHTQDRRTVSMHIRCIYCVLK